MGCERKLRDSAALDEERLNLIERWLDDGRRKTPKEQCFEMIIYMGIDVPIKDDKSGGQREDTLVEDSDMLLKTWIF